MAPLKTEFLLRYSGKREKIYPFMGSSAGKTNSELPFVMVKSPSVVLFA
jgi:hypothetical protein